MLRFQQPLGGVQRMLLPQLPFPSHRFLSVPSCTGRLTWRTTTQTIPPEFIRTLDNDVFCISLRFAACRERFGAWLFVLDEAGPGRGFRVLDSAWVRDRVWVPVATDPEASSFALEVASPGISWVGFACCSGTTGSFSGSCARGYCGLHRIRPDAAEGFNCGFFASVSLLLRLCLTSSPPPDSQLQLQLQRHL